MANLKTKPTKVRASSHIAAIANEEQRADARALVALMRRITGQPPKMWGPTIVGFGNYHYKYASGHEGDSALAAFAVRGRDLVVYIAAGVDGRDALLKKLGKHKAGKVCVYIRRLADVDQKVLETLVARSVAHTERRYQVPSCHLLTTSQFGSAGLLHREGAGLYRAVRFIRRDDVAPRRDLVFDHPHRARGRAVTEHAFARTQALIGTRKDILRSTIEALAGIGPTREGASRGDAGREVTRVGK
jgi:hypothetical protein